MLAEDDDCLDFKGKATWTCRLTDAGAVAVAVANVEEVVLLPILLAIRRRIKEECLDSISVSCSVDFNRRNRNDDEDNSKVVVDDVESISFRYFL